MVQPQAVSVLAQAPTQALSGARMLATTLGASLRPEPILRRCVLLVVSLSVAVCFDLRYWALKKLSHYYILSYFRPVFAVQSSDSATKGASMFKTSLKLGD